MLKFVNDKSDDFRFKVEMLPMRMNKTTLVSKSDALMILSQMFFCILPKQATCKQTSLAELMQIHDEEIGQKNAKDRVRLEKLKCIVNYLNTMFGRKSYGDHQIEFNRTNNFSTSYLNVNKKEKIPLMSVEISSDSEMIEDFYKKGIMVDFANEHIGGGVLGNGAVQE